MPEKLLINEYRASAWKILIIVSASMVILFGGLFVIIESPLWTGIFRLFAFIGLALLVIAFLQLRGRTQQIELEINEKHLIVNYFLSSKKNQEEIFELDTLDRIKASPAPAIWNLLPRTNGIRFTVSFTDTSNKLSLFRFQGQDIFVSAEDAQKIEHFLEDNIQ